MTYMKKTALNLAAIAVVLFFCSSASAAKIECIDHGLTGTYRTGEVRLIGPIEIGDQQKVTSCWETLTGTTKKDLKMLAELNKDEPGRYAFVEIKVPQFVVSSKGGSVSEAMKIGRFVRSKKMWVQVPADWGECLSSCVYILAAGVVKFPWGDVGIHRPYFVSPPNQSYDTAMKSLLSQSKGYFQEMNVPDFLAEDMFSTPPSDIKMLGDVLLTKYRLNQPDMAYEEEKAVRNAAEYGLSRQEYERRRKLSEKLSKECRTSHVYVDKNNVDEAIHLATRCGILADERAGLKLKDSH